METNEGSESKKDKTISVVLHDLICRQVLDGFADNHLLSIEEIFESQPLQRHEVVTSLVKLCGAGIVKAFIADPHMFFGLGEGGHKKLQVLFKKHQIT